MEDRELLELAGKAAGFKIVFTGWPGQEHARAQIAGDLGEWSDWNPLKDDGDALRLAVRLNLTVVCEPHECEVFCDGECLASQAILSLSMVATSAEATDPYTATRRAIVRAAAEIGKTLPPPPTQS